MRGFWRRSRPRRGYRPRDPRARSASFLEFELGVERSSHDPTPNSPRTCAFLTRLLEKPNLSHARIPPTNSKRRRARTCTGLSQAKICDVPGREGIVVSNQFSRRLRKRKPPNRESREAILPSPDADEDTNSTPTCPTRWAHCGRDRHMATSRSFVADGTTSYGPEIVTRATTVPSAPPKDERLPGARTTFNSPYDDCCGISRRMDTGVSSRRDTWRRPT